jgi:cobalamin biosynthetic protein CobC
MASIPHIGAFRHGGRLHEAMAAYPDAPWPWLDLSTGINPAPWTGPRASDKALTRLPDPRDLARLEATAGQAFGVADPARVVAVAGAEAGLRLLVELLDGQAALVSPIYGGHTEAWGDRGMAVASPEAAADVLVVVNPNNPDGRRIARAELEALARSRSLAGRWTIVDESFGEVTPELSVAYLAIERLIVLRSFGKFYGLPGARLGFLILNNALAAKVRLCIGDWPLSADALALGLGAYADKTWQAATRSSLASQAQALDALLTQAGLTVIGGCDLFRWVEADDAHGLFVRLCARGVLTRPFATLPDRLRFGLPSNKDFNRLGEALQP